MPSSDEEPDNVDDDERNVKDKETKESKKKKPKKPKKPAADPTVPKKRPGRPRKIPETAPMQRLGVVETPLNEDNKMEFVYDSPTMTRTVSRFLHTMSSSKINMIFRKREIILYGKDHHEKTSAYIRINTEKVNRYYLETEFEIGILAENLEEVFHNVDKNYTVMRLTSTKEDYKTKITIGFDTTFKIEECHTIYLIADYPQLCDEKMFVDESHCIRLTFDSATFKALVTNMSRLTLQIEISQSRNTEPVVIRYRKELNRKVNSDLTIANDSPMLKSRLPSDKTFRLAFSLEPMKYVCHSQLGQTVVVLLDESLPLTIRVVVDDAAEIFTTTAVASMLPAKKA